MKNVWLKYLFASAMVGLFVGVYQMWFPKKSSLSLSKFQSGQDQQIKNFGTSQLNRAARIARYEQQHDDLDIDIPVTFAQYDYPVGHVPPEKSGKVAVKPYDPNAGLSIDRSNAPAFGQMPIESYPSYPDQSSMQYPDGYEPFSNYSPSKASKPSDQKSKVLEESPTFSKLEYPKEDQSFNQKDKKEPVRKHRNFSDFTKTPTSQFKTKPNSDDAASKNEPDVTPDEPKNDQTSTDENQNPVDGANESGWFKNFMKNLWNWWQDHKPQNNDFIPVAPLPSVQPEPEAELSPETKPYPQPEPSSTLKSELPHKDIVDAEIYFAEPAVKLPEIVKPEVIDSEKKYEPYDQSVRSVDLQKSAQRPSVPSKSIDMPKPKSLRNELAKLEDVTTTRKPRIPSRTQKIEIIEPSNIEILPSQGPIILQENQPEPLEVTFIEPKDVSQITSSHKAFKNKFFQGARLDTNPRIIRKPQEVLQLEPVVQPKTAELILPSTSALPSPSRLKVRRLTSDEEIARDMELLNLPNQLEASTIKPYEQRSLSDPFGQIYFIQDSSTKNIIEGTQEEIEEYLEQRPWWQKIKDAFVSNYKNAPSEYKPLEPSEGEAAEFKEPADLDVVRAEEAIAQLFEGPNPPKVEDVTKEIMPEPSSGPSTFAESVEKIASSTATEAAAIAEGGSAAARIAK